MNEHQKNIVPVPVDDDFGGGDPGRTVQGSIAKFVDGRWSCDGCEFPADTELLVLGTTEVMQHFQDGKLIEEIKEKPFPDVEGLNEAVPIEQWSEGINGPRPPWSHQYVAYLLDPNDAGIYTSINNTVGQRIAIERLASKVKWMRALRGEKVSPLVKLDAKPMPTNKGLKMRPEFTILDWRDLGGGSFVETKPMPQLPPAEAAGQIGKPVKAVSTAEELEDEIPF
jgi:hypothetical protein